MKKAMLDTNFILTCMRQKIDFFRYLEMEGFQILIPVQVIKELENIVGSNKKLYFRENAKLSLDLLKKNNFMKIYLKTKNTDNGIVRFSKKNPGVTIGTLDREIKKKSGNDKIVIRGKSNLEIV